MNSLDKRLKKLEALQLAPETVSEYSPVDSLVSLHLIFEILKQPVPQKYLLDLDALCVDERQSFERKLQAQQERRRIRAARYAALSVEESQLEDERDYEEHLAECRRTGEIPGPNWPAIKRQAQMYAKRQ